MILHIFIFYLFYSPFLIYMKIRNEVIIRRDYKEYINDFPLRKYSTELKDYKKQNVFHHNKMDIDFWVDNKGHREVFSIAIWLLIIVLIYKNI